MKIKNVSFETYGARISIAGKTGSRKILIINATPYLQEWINSHPENQKHDAPPQLKSWGLTAGACAIRNFQFLSAVENEKHSFPWISNQGGLLCYTRIMAILKRAGDEECIENFEKPLKVL